MLLSFVFSLLTFQACTLAQETEEWIPYEGQEYWISKDTGDFLFADRECKTRNGQLAVLTENMRYLYVRNWLNENADRNDYFFINAKRDNLTREFIWGNGVAFPTGSKWGPGQPTQSNTETGEFNCLAMSFTHDRFWMDDVICSNINFNYICERTIVLISHSWSTWGAWSPCSASCSPGSRSRLRICESTNSSGKNLCISGGSDSEMESCNVDLCNVTETKKTFCNATSCGETGHFHSYQTCKVNQSLPEGCSRDVILSCKKRCLQIALVNSAELTPSETTTASTDPSSLSLGPILGGAVAGGVLVVFLLMLCCVYFSGDNKKQPLRVHDNTTPRRGSDGSVISFNSSKDVVAFSKGHLAPGKGPPTSPSRSPNRRMGPLPVINDPIKPHKHDANGDCRVSQQKPINKHLILEKPPQARSLEGISIKIHSPSCGALPALAKESGFQAISDGLKTKSRSNSNNRLGLPEQAVKFSRSKSLPTEAGSSDSFMMGLKTPSQSPSHQLKTSSQNVSVLDDYIAIAIPETVDKSVAQACSKTLTHTSPVPSDFFLKAPEINTEMSEQNENLEFEYITLERIKKDEKQEYDSFKSAMEANSDPIYSYNALEPR